MFQELNIDLCQFVQESMMPVYFIFYKRGLELSQEEIIQHHFIFEYGQFQDQDQKTKLDNKLKSREYFAFIIIHRGIHEKRRCRLSLSCAEG